MALRRGNLEFDCDHRYLQGGARGGLPTVSESVNDQQNTDDIANVLWLLLGGQ